jgi:hypothetical protein
MSFTVSTSDVFSMSRLQAISELSWIQPDSLSRVLRRSWYVDFNWAWKTQWRLTVFTSYLLQFSNTTSYRCRILIWSPCCRGTFLQCRKFKTCSIFEVYKGFWLKNVSTTSKISINYNLQNNSHFLLLDDYFPAVANWLKLRSYMCISNQWETNTDLSCINSLP